MKITITRALAELKSLKNRIYGETGDLKVFAVQRGKVLVDYPAVKPEDFEKKAKAELQSVRDLISRQSLIKSAIDKSNAETVVKIGGKEMTVQEVLNRKLFLESEIRLKEVLMGSYRQAVKKLDACHEENKQRIERMVDNEIAATGGKSSTSKEEKENLLERFTTMVENSSKVELLAPAITSDGIDEFRKELEAFTTEVDYVLSESNSTTFIEIPD